MPEDTEHSHPAEGAFAFARRGGIRCLESTPLCAHDFLSHAFCTRWGGVSRGRLADLNFGVHACDSDENLRRNRELLCSAFDLPGGNPMTVQQVHGDRLLVIGKSLHARAGNGPLAYDGIITPLQGIA
ncbi:MAG: laccase domain-containing protein, partial [Deltaproteobacteria bacterium]|nr:laccase domain-containing protein [Deltaproteobacteria bacterium]